MIDWKNNKYVAIGGTGIILLCSIFLINFIIIQPVKQKQEIVKIMKESRKIHEEAGLPIPEMPFK